MCDARLHIWTKFSENWLETVIYISENVTISFKHEYRRPTLTSRCDVISDVINIKSTFSGTISDDLSISDVKMVASLMSLMASLVTTSRMQQCFNVPIDSYHEFLLLFYCCVLLEIKLTTTTKMNLSKIFRNFQNGRHFEVRAIFQTGSCTETWVLHQDRPCSVLCYELLFDVLA